MRDFKNVKRIVIKIGSSSLVNEDLSINYEMIEAIMGQFKKLIDNNIRPCLVTSGAVAIGLHELGLTKKPKEMALKQACAAVGQAKLMEAYNGAAMHRGLKTGQILVSHDDFQIRKRMVCLSNTLDAMFKNNIIPIINENDALSVEEIKVGDNDTLSAMIAPMVNADLLILFSDIDGLFNKNPKIYNDAVKIDTVEEINEEIFGYAGLSTTSVGTGGMATKINAALISTTAGTDMLICNSNSIRKLYDIILGEELGTLFKASTEVMGLKDNWLIFKTKSTGSIVIDDGCKKILADKKKSILPKGVVSILGDFLKDSIVDVLDNDGNLIGKGRINYSSENGRLIIGHASNEIKDILGISGKKELIHADNLVLIKEDIYGKAIK